MKWICPHWSPPLLVFRGSFDTLSSKDQVAQCSKIGAIVGAALTSLQISNHYS
ncbi:hypothetical protein Syun_024136 [Stephania yunnanensis]|uniref:Uncharacterized protein n=1 Tax=Stephania yunnanensis TaxID=152371 RepID=A0AAP0FEE3_9MAGN